MLDIFNFIKKYLFYLQSNIEHILISAPGNFCEGVTPDPIPNSAVKPFSANGTLS